MESEAALTRGLKALQRLDAIVKNKFANDKPTLSAWESASHVERNNGRTKGESKPGDVKTGSAKTSASGASAGG